MLQAESCPSLLLAVKEVISETEARCMVDLLQAKLQIERLSLKGLSMGTAVQEVASVVLAKGFLLLALHPENRQLLGANGAVNVLVELLKIASDIEQQAGWAICLQNLVLDNPTENGRMAIQAGAIDPLLRLCFSETAWVQFPAATALANLGSGINKEDPGVMEVGGPLIRAGAIEAVVHLLQSTCEGVVQGGAHLAFVLTLDIWSSLHDEYAEAIGAAGIIGLLVNVLNTGSSAAQDNAAGALNNLTVEANWNLFADAEAIQAVIPLLKELSVQHRATSIIYNLAKNSSSHDSIIQAGGVDGLLYSLQTGSRRAQTTAAGAFMHLSENPALRPSLAPAASLLAAIAVKAQDEEVAELQRRASLAVINLVGQRAREY